MSIKISHLLPHLHLPIGLGEEDTEKAMILGLIDTGTGLNIGRLSYHQSIAKHHPELVVQFAFLKDAPGLDPLQISGIGINEKDSTALECTAMITYKMPYMHAGHLIVVLLGLREAVSCNTVFLYPFLSAIKAGILFELMTMTSGRLGEVFPLEAMVLLRAQQALSVPTRVPGAFRAIKAPKIMHKMSHITGMITEVLKIEELEAAQWGPTAKTVRIDDQE